MGGLVKSIFGGNDSAKLAKEEAARSQRQQLATLAREQAEVDQAKATGNKTRGRRLLTFLGGGEGSSTVG